jgi:hypothetical protein
MIFSCRYDNSGRILAWQEGKMLQDATSIRKVMSSTPMPNWAIVQRFPREVQAHDGKWAMENLRVSKVINPAVVEVELVR